MKTRTFFIAVMLLNLIQLGVYMTRQLYMQATIRITGKEIRSLNDSNNILSESLSKIFGVHKTVNIFLDSRYVQVRELMETSRKNYIRIKGVQEKKNENLDAKIVELAEFLDVHITVDEVEKANRIGVKKNNKPRVIIAQLSNYKIKQKLIRQATTFPGNIEFKIQDDVSNHVAPPAMSVERSSQVVKGCGPLLSVGNPVLQSRSQTMFGAWLKDPVSALSKYSKSIWVLPHFYENNVVEEYSNLRDLSRRRPRMKYELPYEWAGTGHAVYNGSLYFNKFNTSVLIKYDFETKSVAVEKNLEGAGFENTSPYQWSGSTDIDFAVDELGLWVIYGTLDNALDIVISKLNPSTLEVEQTWNTNWRKQWCGNAFMACGSLYVLKRFDDFNTTLSYTYDTRTKAFKHISIPFFNKYQYSTMLSYNHLEKKLYAWDRGYLVDYNVTFNANAG